MFTTISYNSFYKWFDRQLRGHELDDRELFVSGGVGHEWHNKAAQTEYNTYAKPYLRYLAQFNEPSKVSEVIEDNILRLTLLSGIDRLITLRQAYGGLKSRFTFADTNTAAFQKIFNQGIFTGYFRGALLGLLQFSTNIAHPLFYSQGNYVNHYLYSSLFELVTFPLDTIKTIYQADIGYKYKNILEVISKSVEGEFGLFKLYQGVTSKLLFNAFLIYHLRNIYEENHSEQLVSLPLLGLSYGLLTYKTRQQISGTQLSFIESGEGVKIMVSTLKNGLYKGVVPFLILNHLFHYNLYALYSKDAQNRVLGDIQHKIEEHFKSPKFERTWK